ncbi:RNA methyltransferase [Paraglaciecola polaris]|uniref:RNA methyltransferase TrmH family n=1 Tax=Paraglaciecola polaris LMG 21857 TaxID=1129793 RepID=K7AFV9_9ALTE|nr:RNA methyltransferase [Paraglaciecola polaris]GAC34175.1 RNA methyltransferase TrmH family [Paraglaciecola polaris LMG 21857]|tara:strand:- start:155 stop:694 length:540 start_codon:yes stop_codon:yes gene_type:complete
MNAPSEHKNTTMGNVALCIINPKSPQNMGSILRAAGCYAADIIHYTGERYARARAFNTDTKNVGLNIPVEHIDTPCAEKHMAMVAVELVEGATPLPHFAHPEHAYYIFGPEDGSIEQAILDKCQHVVYVPTTGCMNLAATVNVVLYDRLAKSSQTQYGDQIIVASRDTNNRTKVAQSSQ